MIWTMQYKDPGAQPILTDSEWVRKVLGIYYLPGTVEEVESIGEPATLQTPFAIYRYQSEKPLKTYQG